MADSVIEQTKSGVRWVGIGQIGIRFISMASTIVLARLLMPADFGTIALARLVLGFILLFGAWGIDAAIIVEEKRSKELLNAAFWINLTIMSILALICFLIIPFVVKFYQMPILKPILIWLGIGLILQSLELVPRSILNKDLNYSYLTRVTLIVELLVNSLLIVMAFMGFGVWSLVVSQIIASPLRAIALWIKTGWFPSWQFKRSDVKYLMSFGRNILGSELLRYANQNTDYFIIGKVLNAVKLGYYTFAYNLANWPVENIVKIVNTVSLPALSKVQSNQRELRNIFLKMTQMVSVITFPVFGFLLGATAEIVTLIYGQKWAPAVRPLQIIILFGVIRSVFAPSGRIFLIKKKPAYLFYLNLAQLPLLVAGVWFGAHYGEIIGVAIAVAIVLSLGGIATLIIVTRLLEMSAGEFLKTLVPGLVSTSIFLVLGFFLKTWMYSIGLAHVIILIFYFLFIFAIYCLTLFLLFPTVFRKTIRLIIEIAGLDVKKIKDHLDVLKNRFLGRVLG